MSDSPLNPFDPARLRISQRIGEGVDLRRVLVAVPVRKPHGQEFIRVHPSEDMWLETTVLDFREERTTYLVDPVLAPQLPGEAVAKVLVTAITRHGQLFLWPIKLPDEHGRLDDWNAAALEAAQRARTKWLCVSPNIPAGTYNVREASGRFADPVWPEVTLEALLSMAFKDRLIDNLEHSVLKRLRGEF